MAMWLCTVCCARIRDCVTKKFTDKQAVDVRLAIGIIAKKLSILEHEIMKMAAILKKN